MEEWGGQAQLVDGAWAADDYVRLVTLDGHRLDRPGVGWDGRVLCEGRCGEGGADGDGGGPRRGTVRRVCTADGCVILCW